MSRYVRALQVRRKRISPPYTPGSLYECQNKRLTKFALRKWLILKDASSIDCALGKTPGKRKTQQGCRVSNVGLPIYYKNREGRASQGKAGVDPVGLQRRRKRQAEIQKGPPIRIGGPLRLRVCAAAR